MKKIIASVGLLILAYSCTTNPFTGKKTMALVPDSEIFPMSFQQYSQFLSENKVITGTKDAMRVESVANKIKVASERWLTANGNIDYLKDYKWEYKLVDSKEVNAWCMPGGKIVVYTGILPITKDDAGLAAVLGHEVAHALANHGQQRMSAGLIQQAGGVAVAVATKDKSPEAQQAWMQAYGIGSQVGGMLPFSRSHETEADQIGLLLMTIAGYTPESAVQVWERMSAMSGGQNPPEFLSTHPSNQTRIDNLKSWIPQVKEEAAKFNAKTK